MSPKTCLLVFIGAMLFSTNAKSLTTEDSEEFVADVNEMFTDITEAINSGDLERWLAYWADDGVQMPPGEPAVIGKTALRDRLEAQFDQFTWRLSMTVDEVRRDGRLAYASGVFQASLLPKAGGDATALNGKYLIILTRDSDGSWKIYRDIFNLSGLHEDSQ